MSWLSTAPTVRPAFVYAAIATLVFVFFVVLP